MRDRRAHETGHASAGMHSCLPTCPYNEHVAGHRRDQGDSLRQNSLRLLSLLVLAGVSLYASGSPAVGAATEPPGLQVQFQQLDTSSYPEITCYLSVAEQNKPVLGLTQGEISLAVDGSRLGAFTARSVTEDGAQIAVALAIDTSGSMKGAPLTAAQDAAKEFVGRLSEADEAGLIAFGARPVAACEFTANREQLRSAIEATTARGNTALYDAVLLGLDQLASQSSPRKALLVLTDGKDTESKASKEACLAKAKSAGAPIFPIGLGAKVNQDIMRALADESGGESFFTAASGELLGIYQRIAEQLNSQYVLSYRDPQPSADAGPWREAVIEVQYAGQAASASRRYLQVTDGPETPNGRSLSPILLGIIAVAALDLVLVVGWLLRRRAGAQLRG